MTSLSSLNVSQSAIQTSSLSLSARMVAGAVMLFLGSGLLFGVGFAGDSRLHNAAHDTRHGLGFPCH